jgi:hypothetical protein
MHSPHRPNGHRRQVNLCSAHPQSRQQKETAKCTWDITAKLNISNWMTSAKTQFAQLFSALEIDQKYDRPILDLGRVGKLSLNATNVIVMNCAFGFEDKDWMNQEIELYAGLTRFDGKDQDSILIKPLSSPNPDATRNPRPAKRGDGMDDEIPF